MDYNNLKYGSISSEADAWIVRLRADNVSRADKVRFSRWLNTSAAHRRAFDEALADWEALGAPTYILENNNEAASGAESINKESVANVAYHPSFWRRLIRPLPATFIAASIALVLTITVFNTMPNKSIEAQRYESATGETRTLSLADGSVVQLNTDTLIEVAFSDKRRYLQLIKGEAFFNVASDRKRPLVVDFGTGTATAVGTAFNVYRSSSSSSSVTVTEGLVDVRESADIAVPNPDPKRLKHNQYIRIDQRGLSAIRNVSPARTLAWREGAIIFKDTPLLEALAELNRYMSKPAYGEDISDLKISGTFSLASPEETLDAIVTAFDLETRDAAPYNALYLHPAN